MNGETCISEGFKGRPLKTVCLVYPAAARARNRAGKESAMAGRLDGSSPICLQRLISVSARLI